MRCVGHVGRVRTQEAGYEKYLPFWMGFCLFCTGLGQIGCLFRVAYGLWVLVGVS